MPAGMVSLRTSSLKRMVSLWALVCITSALNQSGILDPHKLYKLYKHMHSSDVGTSLGSSMGGTESLTKMFKDHCEEKEVQNDVLVSFSLFSPGLLLIIVPF